MDTEPINLSPARRARRCLLNLLVLLIVAVGAYLGLRSDGSPLRSGGMVLASSGAPVAHESPSASTQQALSTKDVQLQVSMKNSIASAYLVTPSTH